MLHLKWLLGGALALLAAWSVLYLEFDTLVLLLATTVLVPLALLRPDLPARLPAVTGRLIVPLVVGQLVWDIYSHAEMLGALTRLDLALLLFRAVTYRTRREDQQLILLALFLVVVAGVLTVALAFVVQILAFTACALLYLGLLTLIETEAGGGEPKIVPGERPAWTRLPRDRLLRQLLAVLDWRVVSLAVGLFVGVMGVTAVLFLSIPRFQFENSFFFDRLMTHKTRTGFTDNVRLGDVIAIQNDNSLALRVDVSNPASLPVEPYWRMLVLDQYHDGVFTMSAPLQRWLRRSGHQDLMVRSMGVQRADPAEGNVWTIYLEPGVSRYLPLPSEFSELRFREAQQVETLDSERIVALRRDPATMTAFRLSGVTTEARVPDWRFANRLARTVSSENPDEDRIPTMQTIELDSPDDRARLDKVLRSVTGGAVLSPRDFARRAVNWLTEHHGYSMNVVLAPGEGDPIVRWLDSTQPGHCEYFAGAFTMLARAAGFPARVVVGFEGGTWNGFENYLMVKNSDAHAWAELWDGDGAWLRVDPTAGPAGVPSAQTGGKVAETAMGASSRMSDKSWSARLDSLRILWYRRIVSFDQRSQWELLVTLKKSATSVVRDWRDGLVHFSEEMRAWLESPWDFRLLVVVAYVIATPLACWSAVRVWRRQGWRMRRGRGLHPVRLEAGRWLRRLAPPEQSLDASVLADLRSLRYGPPQSWPEPTAVFRAARGALREARRRRRQSPRDGVVV